MKCTKTGVPGCCLRVPMFWNFSRTPTCDGKTHTDTGLWHIPHRE